MNPEYRYDPLLNNLNADELKKMAVLWGASNRMRKDECVAWLRTALADPLQVQVALARMRYCERAALGVMRQFGNPLDYRSLILAIRTTGTAPESAQKHDYYERDALARSFLERGIVMAGSGSTYFDSYSFNSSQSRVFSDSRMLAQVESLEVVPFPLRAASVPNTSTFRRSQSVLLDIISLLRAADAIGGVGLTKARELKVNDVRKLARKMGWGEQVEFDGLSFHEPTRAFILVMKAAGLLTENEGTCTGATTLSQVGALTVTEAIRRLIGGVTGLHDWVEHEPQGYQYWYNMHGPVGGMAVLVALRCLPSPLEWYRFSDFEQALYDRIGEFYSISGIRSAPFLYGKSTDEARAAMDAWRREVRDKWEKSDLPWLQGVFQTWLYAFGLVEVSLSAGEVDSFRLTDAGRAVLWNEIPDATALLTAEPTPSWVVQPNFDVVVYLESASAEQVAFLERYAARTQVAQHIAQYRLTRDSVYEGLQGEGGVDGFLEGLAAGSRVELPSNIVAEIRFWASLRERVVVRRQASLLEFADMAARQSAVERGVSGKAVGERFLLLSESDVEKSAKGVSRKSFDYAEKPRRCLDVSEDGLISFLTETHDLLTLGYLNLWAEREGEVRWRLTRKSVTEAIQRGRTAMELRVFLQDRLPSEIPPLLLVALRAWGGEAVPAGMAEAVVLQCQREDVFDALTNSRALQPYLLAVIGPDAILVDSKHVDKVRAVLEWAGVHVSQKISDYLE